MAFEENSNVDLDPDYDANESRIQEALLFQRKALAFQPQKWCGQTEICDGEIKAEAQLTAPPPAGIPSITFGYTKPFIRAANLRLGMLQKKQPRLKFGGFCGKIHLLTAESSLDFIGPLSSSTRLGDCLLHE